MTQLPASDGGGKSRALPNGWLLDEMSRSETDYLYGEIVVDKLYYSPRVVDEPGLIVDVGANIGLFALYADATWRPKCLICIEAIPDLREVLRRNLARNAGNLHAVLVPDLAAGAKHGSSDFLFYPEYSIMSGRRADPAEDFALVRDYAARQLDEGDDEQVRAELDDLLCPRFEAEHREVRVAPLTSICAEAGHDAIDLLKIDVEGDEAAVLEGLGELRVRNAIIEVDARRSSVSAVRSMLEARDLSVTEVVQAGYETSPLSVLIAHGR